MTYTKATAGDENHRGIARLFLHALAKGTYVSKTGEKLLCNTREHILGLLKLERIWNIGGKLYNNINRTWVLGYVHGYQDRVADEGKLKERFYQELEQQFRDGTLKFTKEKGLHNPKA